MEQVLSNSTITTKTMHRIPPGREHLSVLTERCAINGKIAAARQQSQWAHDMPTIPQKSYSGGLSSRQSLLLYLIWLTAQDIHTSAACRSRVTEY